MGSWQEDAFSQYQLHVSSRSDCRPFLNSHLQTFIKDLPFRPQDLNEKQNNTDQRNAFIMEAVFVMVGREFISCKEYII